MMKSRKILFGVILVLLISLTASFVKGIFPPSGKKKYNLSIVAIFRNEKPYLREWIEYHRLVGVDHFYLYNNKSSDGSLEVLSPFIARGIVTLIDWPDTLEETLFNKEEYDTIWALSTQLPAYEN